MILVTDVGVAGVMEGTMDMDMGVVTEGTMNRKEQGIDPDSKECGMDPDLKDCGMDPNLMEC